MSPATARPTGGREGRVARQVLALVISALLAAFPPSLSAEESLSPSSHERARSLFEQGVAAADGGDLDGAIARLDESFALFPHPGTLLNLALFRDRDGHRLAAFESYGELLSRYGTVISAETRERVESRLTALEADLAAVTFEGAPPGTTIRIDDGDAITLPLDEPLHLVPGTHRFEAGAEGHVPFTTSRDLSAGERLSIEIALVAIARPLLVVESSTAGARAAIGDGPLEPLPLRREMYPGEVALRVVADGHEPHQEVVEIPARGERRVNVDLVPSPAPPPPARRSFWRGPWPWLIGALVVTSGAAVGLGVGLSGDDEPASNWTVRTP